MPYWRLFYHLVWATKGRAPLIGEREEGIIRRSFHLTFNDINAVPHAIGLMPDHVHVAVAIPPRVAVAEMVKRLKGASSHAVNDQHTGGFAWQEEYGALSFSERGLPAVIAYVSNQPAHHAANNLWPGLERITEAKS